MWDIKMQLECAKSLQRQAVIDRMSRENCEGLLEKVFEILQFTDFEINEEVSNSLSSLTVISRSSC